MTATPRHVALLRGINLGNNRIPMKRLAAMFEEAGCSDVRTYIASGNVVFSATPALARSLPRAISTAIRNELDFEPPIVLRTAAEMSAIVEANPFTGADADADDKKLHVVFLADAPTADAVARLDPERSPPDEFVVNGSEIYLFCPEGLARTKLSNPWFDKTLDTVSTMRNWRTTRKLREMACS